MQAKQQFIQQVQDAYENRKVLHIRAGQSKSFLLPQLGGVDKANSEDSKAEYLDLKSYTGIVNYQPSELTLTALAGTPLLEIEQCLAEKGQMLGFEPPHFSPNATIGGTIACGLSGPRRPYSGAARDFVLGCQIVNGQAQELKFGGEVMKNVAGYDVSRLMVGSYGTLGAILQVSIKVLPVPKYEQSWRMDCSYAQAFEYLHAWIAAGHPISAASFQDQRLTIRFSGAMQSVTDATWQIQQKVATQEVDQLFWTQLKEQQLDFFQTPQNLWRVSLPAAADSIPIEAPQLIDWGGALRWISGDFDATEIRQAVAQLGGQAQLFRLAKEPPQNLQSIRQHPLSSGLFKLHQQVKLALDPKGIFNPAYLYPQL